MKVTTPRKSYRFTLFIGSHDKDNKALAITPEYAKETIRGLVKEYNVAYSVLYQKGGYVHDNGEYIYEDSLQMVMMDVTEDIAYEIGEKVCKAFNQEKIVISKEEIYINELSCD